jgi:hypothetical protein
VSFEGSLTVEGEFVARLESEDDDSVLRRGALTLGFTGRDITD